MADTDNLDAAQELAALRLAFAEAQGGGVAVWPSAQGWIAQVRDTHGLLAGAGRHEDPVTAILLAAENAAARRATKDTAMRQVVFEVLQVREGQDG